MSVNRILCTSKFTRAIKKLQSDNKNDVIADVKKKIDDLADFKITSQKHNHPLKNADGIKDIHIRGDIVLLYRYSNNALVVDLELHNLVNHKELTGNTRKKSLSGNANIEYKK